MSDYTKTTNFTAKDALTRGDPNKLIKGSLFDTEFDAIATAVATKATKPTSPTTNNLYKVSSGGDLQEATSISDSGTEVTIATGRTFNVFDNGGFKLNGTAVTSTAAELNILDGVVATTSEINKLSGLTASTAELNYLDGQVGATFSNGWVAAGGTANALTADFTPSFALSDGLIVAVRPTADNTSADVTINVNDTAAYPIELPANQNILPKMIKSGVMMFLAYDSTNTAWILLNPYDPFFMFGSKNIHKHLQWIDNTANNGPVLASTSGGGTATVGTGNTGVVSNGGTTSGNKGTLGYIAPASTSHDNLGFDDSVFASFKCTVDISIGTSMSNCEARFYMGNSGASSDGFGFLINTSGQWVGEVDDFGTKSTQALTGTPTAVTGDVIEARFYKGTKCEFYLNGTLVGTYSTVANLPETNTSLQYYFQMDVTNTGTASGTNTFTVPTVEIMQIDLS